MKFSVIIVIVLISFLLLFNGGSNKKSISREEPRILYTRGSSKIVLEDTSKSFTIYQLDSMLCKVNSNIMVVQYKEQTKSSRFFDVKE